MALTSLSFKMRFDGLMDLGFWIIHKFTRGKRVKIVKIRVDPIKIANNKSRIIDTAQLRFNISKLLSSYRICIRGFINWHFRRIILSPATYLIFQKGNIMICNFTAGAISIHSTSWNSLGCTSIIGDALKDMEWKELLS